MLCCKQKRPKRAGGNVSYARLGECLMIAVEKISWFRITDMPGQDPFASDLSMDFNEVLREVKGLRVFGPLYDRLHAPNKARPLIFLGQYGLVLVYRDVNPSNGAEVMRIAIPTAWTTPHLQQLIDELFDVDHEAARSILEALDRQLLRWVIDQEERLATARRTLHEVGVMRVLLEELNALR